ncbi:MAG: polysaccharide pyruvyl transferase family protein [Candidatus Omnitrophota bacterium]|jgi:hypothetical protein
MTTNKIKVGILTLYPFNHGALLQAYCLQEAVKELGVAVKIIHYRKINSYVLEYRDFLGNPKQYIRPRTLKVKILTLLKLIKLWRNRRFLQLTDFSQNIGKITAKEKFDIVILGSDEIWNYKNAVVGFDLTYFGKGIKTKKLVSYGVSFGQVNFGEKINEQVVDCLRHLNCISVRDLNSLEIIRSFSLKAEKVLDPTFLHDICLPPFGKKLPGYILVYLNFISRENVFYIREYARKNNKKLIAIGLHMPWCDMNFIDVDVFEWLNFIKHADSVITNTFHGTIFSILYKKSFCVLDVGTKVNKISSLLDDFNLIRQKTDNAKNLNELLNQTLDYSDVFKIVDRVKRESLNYLKKSIGMEGAG